MDAMMKRGGKSKSRKTMKQKQSVVIKNVINIGEKKRMRPRQRRARKQPQDGRQPTGGGGGAGGRALLNPVGVQFPYQNLFQPQPNNVRSLTMSSANSNEANNNVSALIDKSQQITEGKLLSYINNALSFNAVKRMVESEATKEPFSINQPFIQEVEDELDYEEYEKEQMPVIKKEPIFREKSIDKTPIDLTLDEENEIRSDLGIPKLEKPKEKVVVEDVSAEEKKDELLPSTEKMRETIVKPPSIGKTGLTKLPHGTIKAGEEYQIYTNIMNRLKSAKTEKTKKKAFEDMTAYREVLLKRREDEKKNINIGK
jgi:hypothetical protein